MNNKVSEYWIGEGIDYEEIWNAFNSAKDSYTSKFLKMQVSLVQIQFAYPAIQYPLTNLEAIYKTFKRFYYDYKKACLEPHEFQLAGPLFIYDIERNCSIYNFLIETAHVASFLCALYWAYLQFSEKTESIKEKKLNNFQKQIDLVHDLQKNPEKLQIAKTFINDAPVTLKNALENLFSQHLTEINASNEPFNGNIEHSKQHLIQIKLDKNENIQ